VSNSYTAKLVALAQLISLKGNHKVLEKTLAAVIEVVLGDKVMRCKAQKLRGEDGVANAVEVFHRHLGLPGLIFVRPRFDVYQKISTSIHAIFKRYTDLVEGVALDEAYLDVTENRQNITYASTMA
jgi:nucleotidyltransferase/DNA polymerase involved in DNA repair